MKKFIVELSFLDEENEILTKPIELRILTQSLIERISELFGKIEKLRTLQGLIQNESKIRSEIAEKEDNPIEKLKNMRTNMREIKREYKALCTEKLYIEKLEIIKDILTINKVQDDRFYNDKFWSDSVDPAEMQDFLIGVLTRGKKKEMNQEKES